MFNFIRNIFKDLLGDKEQKLIARESSKAVLLKLAGLFIGYLFTILIAKKFGAEILGVFLLAITVLNFISALSSFGLDTTLVAFIPKLRRNSDFNSIRKIIRRSYLVIVVIGLTLSITVFFFSRYIGSIFFENSLLYEYLNMIIICVIPLTLGRLNANILRAYHKIDDYALVNYVLVNLISLIAFLSFIVITDTPLAIVLAFILGSVLALIFSAFYAWRTVNGHQNKVETTTLRTRELLSYSFPILLSDLLRNGKSWVSIFLIGYFLAESDVGVFGIVLKLAVVPTFFIIAVNTVVVPKISEAHDGEANLQRLLTKAARLIFWSGIPILFLLAFIGMPILSILGGEFMIGFVPLFILLIGQLFDIVGGTANYMLQVIGRQKVHSAIMFIGTALLIILSLILIPSKGIVGAALAITISSFFHNLILVAYIKFKLNLKSYYFPFF